MKSIFGYLFAVALAFALPAQAAPVSINFDGSGAPCCFVDTTPLTTAYAAQGVTFSGGNGNGLSILDQSGAFGFNARSGTEFAAWNTDVQTGTTFILSFSGPVTSASIWGAGGSNILLEAFDANNNLVDSASVGPLFDWQLLAVSGNIDHLQLTVDANSAGAFDDLVFDTGRVSRVPVPATLLLLVTGLAGLRVVRRRRH